MKKRIRQFLRDEAGQMAAEYSLLNWFFIFLGTVSIAWFFMAMEEAAIDFYQDVVSIVCLPVP